MKIQLIIDRLQTLERKTPLLVHNAPDRVTKFRSGSRLRKQEEPGAGNPPAGIVTDLSPGCGNAAFQTDCVRQAISVQLQSLPLVRTGSARTSSFDVQCRFPRKWTP